MYKIIYSDENKGIHFDVLGFDSDHQLVLNLAGHFKEQTPVFKTMEEAEAYIYDEVDVDNYEHIGLYIVPLNSVEQVIVTEDKTPFKVNDHYGLIGLTYSLLEEQEDKTLKAQELMTAILNYTVDFESAGKE